MNLGKPDLKWYIQQKAAQNVKERLYGYPTHLNQLPVQTQIKFSIPTEFVGCINDQDQKDVIKILKFTHLKWLAKNNSFALGYNKINNQKRQGHLSIFDLNDWKLFYKKFANDEAMVGILNQEYLNKVFGIGSNGGIYTIEKGQGGLEQRPVLETKILQITEGSFSPNHHKIAFSSQDKLIYLYDVQSESKETLMGHGKEVYTVQWNPENSLIISGADDETIRLWDASSRDEILNLKRHNLGVKKVRWNRNGTYFATTGKDKQTLLFDLRKMDMEIFKLHQTQVDTIFWHPKYQNIFLTGDANGSISCYNINAPNEPMYVQHVPETIVTDLALDSSGSMMSVIRAKQVQPDQKISMADQISIYKTA
ncbi:unnamed protein product (macronuclear) [Paramecium tetraurelia]|uniref:Translation initiation factor beta propellor-like domain-containing protein n=1 Tax=Paramecium tetraurelia TaxID=5888 RepID=A0C8Q1_PARTE|nr:uncharacterized protein GSPATT00036303001 [Paramecium tetraurelia]CAK67168.1 unnamed protein product [Paramecium tetraurelia]|eukprot:XP_001434565.1 hypothetical protein (macronuclear) [Paramecium tetraurelia strain d4-2]